MKQTITFKFAVGDKVEHILTGFQGIISGLCYYLSGCSQYHVRPKMVVKKTEQHKQPEGCWFDEEVLKLIDGGLNVPLSTPSGGPRHGDAPVMD